VFHSYRDRAKERRLKYGEVDPLPINKAKERFQREMEKKASLAQSYQSSTLASKPIDDTNIGSKMLKAMGWKGSGLGKDGRGRVEIIETEQRVGSAGLGSKSSSYGAGKKFKFFNGVFYLFLLLIAGPGDDYKTYIKKMMKKRYEEVP
jgi:RNA-binding protein 5/10